MSSPPDPFAELESPRRPLRPWLVALLALALAGAAFLWYHFTRKDRARAAVTASSGRLTLDRDDGGDLQSVDRRARPELWYRVKLEGAPVGERLRLRCEWVDPAGKVYHRNNYETRLIDSPDWPTHARCRLGPDAPAGTWTVRLSLEGRVLHSRTFEVRDGAQ